MLGTKGKAEAPGTPKVARRLGTTCSPTVLDILALCTLSTRHGPFTVNLVRGALIALHRSPATGVFLLAQTIGLHRLTVGTAQALATCGQAPLSVCRLWLLTMHTL